MDNCILTSIKTKVSLMRDDENFDDEIIDHINAAFAELTQLGVGPKGGFRITGYDETWDDYQIDIVQLEMAKEFVSLYTRLVFDPPTNGSAINYIQKRFEEVSWRIKVQAEEV